MNDKIVTNSYSNEKIIDPNSAVSGITEEAEPIAIKLADGFKRKATHFINLETENAI